MTTPQRICLGPSQGNQITKPKPISSHYVQWYYFPISDEQASLRRFSYHLPSTSDMESVWKKRFESMDMDNELKRGKKSILAEQCPVCLLKAKN